MHQATLTLASLAISTLCLSARANASLIELTDPTVTNSSSAVNSGFTVDNLFDNIADGSSGSQYASNAQGVGTFVNMDFSAPTVIAGFQHIERAESGPSVLHGIVTSTLTFSNQSNFSSPIATVTVNHVTTPLGETDLEFDSPITARFVKWTVTEIKSNNNKFVGGSEMTFYTVPEPASLALMGLGCVLIIRRRAS